MTTGITIAIKRSGVRTMLRPGKWEISHQIRPTPGMTPPIETSAHAAAQISSDPSPGANDRSRMPRTAQPIARPQRIRPTGSTTQIVAPSENSTRGLASASLSINDARASGLSAKTLNWPLCSAASVDTGGENRACEAIVGTAVYAATAANAIRLSAEKANQRNRCARSYAWPMAVKTAGIPTKIPYSTTISVAKQSDERAAERQRGKPVAS